MWGDADAGLSWSDVHGMMAAARVYRRASNHKLMDVPAMKLLAAALLVFTPLSTIAQSERADLILIHGQVLTVDAHDTVAQAVAIRRGVILKAGSDADIQAFAAPDARVMDHGCRFHANES